MKGKVTAGAGIDTLRDAGISTVISGPNTILLSLDQNKPAILARLRVLQSPPTPSRIETELATHTEHLVYVVPHTTKSLLRAALNPRVIAVSLKDRSVHFLGRSQNEGVHTSFLPAQQVSTNTPTASYRRPPFGRYALIRSLLRTSTPRTQTQLAVEAGITQAAVSTNLRALGPQVVASSAGWRAADPCALFSEFVTNYPGPKGIATYWFSLKPVREISLMLLKKSSEENSLLVSADVGADLYAPWRYPQKGVLYARAPLFQAESLPSLGLAEADSDDANIEFIVPADYTIWVTARAWSQMETKPVSPYSDMIADPLIIAWDVARTGGPDAREAVEKIRNSVLKLWEMK